MEKSEIKFCFSFYAIRYDTNNNYYYDIINQFNGH